MNLQYFRRELRQPNTNLAGHRHHLCTSALAALASAATASASARRVAECYKYFCRQLMATQLSTAGIGIVSALAASELNNPG